MDNVISNPCVRCGKERIVGKTWVEENETGFGTSRIKHTLLVCPDAECQKKLDEELTLQQEKRTEKAQLRAAQDLEKKNKVRRVPSASE